MTWCFLYVWSFLDKQCISSLPLFQRNTNEQTYEVDGMLKQFRATVPFLSQLVKKKGTEEGHLLQEPVSTYHQLRASACQCYVGKEGGSLCIVFTKKLQTCLPTSRRPGKPYLFFLYSLSIAQEIESRPLRPIWKLFHLFMMCGLLRWPLIS